MSQNLDSANTQAAAATKNGWQAWEIAENCKNNPQFIDTVTQHYLHRIHKYKEQLNSHLFFDEKDVLAQIAALKNRPYKDLPLAFVPVMIKDNICTHGIPTTCGSKMLAGYIPPYDAAVIEKLKKAGAIIYGKVNCDEFAMGSSNENSAFGPVKNPWNLNKVPGGSSGGSAAVIAADLSPLSLGSDTGGSIRQPASYCGVVGLKPTYGSVSRYGLIAFSSSLDQIGPFAKNIKDCALLFDVIKGHDERDSTSSKQAEQLLPSCYLELQKFAQQKTSLAGVKVGIIKEFFAEGMNNEVRKSIEVAVDKIKQLGAEIISVSLPNIKYAISAYYIIATAEASSNLARFDGIRFGYRSDSDQAKTSLQKLYEQTRRDGFGAEVKRRIFLGTFVLSSGYRDAYYTKATRVRKMIADDFAEAFAKVDLLIGPTAPTTAFSLNEKVNDPLAMYLNDIYTIGINLAELPALSQPCGFDESGLPVGLQWIGPKFSEASLLKGAYAYEQATKWLESRRPSGF